MRALTPGRPPSTSTSASDTKRRPRVLKARGFVTPQPHKRLKSSYTRFVADLPNERWQADLTHVPLPNGEVFEALNIIDDHSRVCVASRVMDVLKAHDVVRVLHKAAETWGYPASFLTFNGLIFTVRTHFGVEGVVEQGLIALASRPSTHVPTIRSDVSRHHTVETMELEPTTPCLQIDLSVRPLSLRVDNNRLIPGQTWLPCDP